MSCDIKKEMLIAYSEGALDERNAARVREHCASCEACRTLLAEYTQSWEMLGEWKSIKPKPDYLSHFWTELGHQEPWYVALRDTLQSVRLSRRLAYQLALAAVVILTIHVSVYKYIDTVKTRELLINISEEEWEMLENYDLIANLDVLENSEGII